jgi:amino-acid N-acetyltransferase
MPKGDWALRPMGVSDIVAMKNLLRAVGLPTDGVGGEFAAGYVLAERNGALVGAAGVEVYGRSGLLRSVAVEPSQRGLGLGRLLVEDRLHWAAANCLRTVYLLTTTAAAAGFFSKLEFATIERAELATEVKASEEFSRICPETATAMVRRLEAIC